MDATEAMAALLRPDQTGEQIPSDAADFIGRLSRQDVVRLLCVSDSHRDVSGLSGLLEQVPDTDLIVHLGDHERPYSELTMQLNHPVLAVAGNCDRVTTAQVPEIRRFELAGRTILMMHGHARRINVKIGLNRLKAFAASLHPLPDLVLFGHTHFYHNESFQTAGKTVHLLNPGSASASGQLTAGGMEIILQSASLSIRRLYVHSKLA